MTMAEINISFVETSMNSIECFCGVKANTENHLIHIWSSQKDEIELFKVFIYDIKTLIDYIGWAWKKHLPVSQLN